MKKVVKFEFFEPGQYLFFDIMRLAQLEKLLGESLVKVMERAVNGDISINFMIAALTVGLKQHYPRGTEQFFADKMTEYVENGGNWQDMISAVSEAVISIWMPSKTEETDGKNAATVQKPKSKA